MDIEKLIERLRENTDCWTDKVHGYANIRLEAATALSALQAENEKLRAELEQVKREHGMFQPVLNGKNAQEKQAILVRLRVYRKARGLGCLEEVAREAGTGFTEDLLRGLLTGDSSISIPQWRKLNKALDKLENSEEVPGE